MIIWGTRGVTYKKGKGSFYCPQCAAERDYAHKRIRRFFTLYFIPVVPMGLHAEFVECAQCRGAFELKALEYDPESEHQEAVSAYVASIVLAMAHVAGADGVIEDAEREAMRSTYLQITGQALSEQTVQAALASAGSGQDAFLGELAQLAPMLNDAGKERVIHAALAVAAADGSIQEEEQAVMGQIADALALSPAHLRGVLSEFEQSA